MRCRALHADTGVPSPPLLLLLLLVTACAGGDTGGQEGPSPGAAAAAAFEPGKIISDLPDFDAAATRRTLSRDPHSGNAVHYAAFGGADSFAAVVLVEAASGYTLEPRDLTRHFERMLPATPIVWGARGSVREAAATTATTAAAGPGTSYRLFELPETGFRCFAFDEQWRPAVDEDGGRWYTRQGFGFYCRAAERALGEGDIRRVLARISFAGGDV